ncbi:hypothetical protein NQ315_011572 [Exocentrus adspersus]|uniref:Peptidase S1 domain-containing protein n=1 Tax=Exocentrus adspersus TaxID=1586481 RepID=A0AAV8VVC4_9CUCU|nr:hypothetical protein NQ315_011572 [Exocentrus adspersus]
MKVIIYLLVVSGFSVALPSQFYQSPWNEIKGKNVYVKPASNYTSDKRNVGNGRIIYGREAVPHSLPYQAALLVNGSSLCGGSLISPNYVLTAAHCTFSASYVEIILGAHNINIQESSQMRLTSTNIIIHEDYTPESNSNDISLIKTPNHIVTNNYIQIVKLAQSGAGPYDQYIGLVSGWGSSDSSPAVSAVLRQTYARIISNEVCSEFYEPGVVQSSTMCTYKNALAGPCNGDSGGPLVAGDGDVQVGLVSFLSSSDCRRNDPDGYTRISYYRTWINRNSDL